LWPGNFDIPFERDPKLGTQAYLSDAEVKSKQSAVDDRRKTVAGEKAVASANDAPQWRDFRDANRQSSLIIDPPDGRLPRRTQEAEKRQKADKVLADALTEGRQFDSYEEFNLWNRCISRGIFGSLTSTIYNNGNQILQEPGYVIIRNEMIHEARIIPLDGGPHVGDRVRLYMGDSRGHWEEDTLVIETTNMTDKAAIEQENIANAGRPTEALRFVERITRTAPDRLNYELTVDDQGTWTRPWTIRLPFRADPSYQLYEYACHESNYGLRNILEGSRAAEKKGAKSAGAGKAN
jgi:hypothetical protein